MKNSFEVQPPRQIFGIDGYKSVFLGGSIEIILSFWQIRDIYQKRKFSLCYAWL